MYKRVLFQVFQINLRLCAHIVWLNNPKMPYYAVARGRATGIFMTWADCEAQVKGFSGAKYKKFDSVVSAEAFISTEGGSGNSYSAKTNPTKYKNNVNTTNNQKRSYSTSSSNYQKNNDRSSGSKPTTQVRNSRPKDDGSSHSDQLDDDSAHSDQFDDDLDIIISKQMDDIEKRLKTFEKGVDKIIKKGTKSSSRTAILIEPPKPKRLRKSANNDFEEDGQGYVQVYTDGACSANGRSSARAGIGVYWGEGHSHNVSEPVTGRATNNCGEIQAATCAIKQAIQSGLKKLTINTDSQFLINAVTKWMPGWKRKGWKLASGEPVKNETDFKDLDSVQNKIDIKWNYVEAHRGIHGNEMADQLAKAGAALYNK